MKVFVRAFFIVIIFTSCLLAQVFSPYQLRSKSARPSTDYTLVPKKSGHYTAEDWAAVIDSTWGPGLPTNQKLAIFDEAWNKINTEFAAFHGLDINWDSLKTLYRNQIDSTTSRGRFAAIMSYMILALEEGHAYIWDATVTFTPLIPGVPLFYMGGNADNTSHFGATLTPLPDSSLLILKTISNHPLGLVPGDIVLGYDGTLWKNLIKELMSFQLPIYWSWSNPGADKISNSHNLLCGAGMNWHLFDTLDVVKYATGDTMHFPTASLAGQNEFIWGNEQLPVPGVDWIYDGPDNIHDPLNFGDYVSWGIVDGSNIGYIYAVAWVYNRMLPGTNISQQFYDAIYNLMLIQNVDGLIIDQRLNYGGQWQYQQGLSLLYNSTFRLFGFDERCGDPNNHYQMCPYTQWDSYFTTHGDPMTIFDRPIAVLIGPAAVSCGDMFALTMKSHPMARLFGKPTNGSFSTYPGEYNLNSNLDWTMSHTNSNGYLLDNPGNYLSHHGIRPNEEVWFTAEDVAKGEDTVVKRAIEWIQNLAHAHDVIVEKILGTDDVIIHTTVENPNEHTLSVKATIENEQGIIDSLLLFDDGNHDDGLENDGIMANRWLVPAEEEYYSVDVRTDDLTADTERILPDVGRFTTIGPVVLKEYIITSSDTIPHPGDNLIFEFTLRNDGLTMVNVSGKIVPLDTLASLPSVVDIAFGNIEPGQSKTSNRIQNIKFSENCPDSIYTHFRIDIFRGDYPYWNDTFSVFVHKDPSGFLAREESTPDKFVLKQNYPNPFNPTTVISYQLPVISYVEVSLFNLLGQEVVTLVSERQKSGHHQVQWDASGYASGIYYYKIKAGEFQDVKKMILLQ